MLFRVSRKFFSGLCDVDSMRVPERACIERQGLAGRGLGALPDMQSSYSSSPH